MGGNSRCACHGSLRMRAAASRIRHVTRTQTRRRPGSNCFVVFVMGRRRRRPDDDDVDMTSYDDVTRSSALLAYIELTASDGQLGISVVGYIGQRGGAGLYVSQVHDHSAAMRDDRLQRGDKLNSINGLRLTHLDNDDAFQLLKATVSRQLGSDHTLRLGIIRSRDDTVLRHWQRWSLAEQSGSSSCPAATTTAGTTASSSDRPTAVVRSCSSSDDVYVTTTTRF